MSGTRAGLSMVTAAETPLGPHGRCQGSEHRPRGLRGRGGLQGPALEDGSIASHCRRERSWCPESMAGARTRPRLGYPEGRRGAAQGQRGRPGHSGRARAAGRQVPQPLLRPTATQGPTSQRGASQACFCPPWVHLPGPSRQVGATPSSTGKACPARGCRARVWWSAHACGYLFPVTKISLPTDVIPSHCDKHS